jgi:hypothetical protein
MKNHFTKNYLVAGFLGLSTLFALTGNAYSQGCTEGLVSYWKMDETSGTTLTDYVSGNNATRHNSTINSVTGKIDGAHFYYFDEGTEVGQYATAPDNDIYSFPANSGFTISYFLKFTETQYGLGAGQDHIIISKGDWNGGAPNKAFWASGVNGSGFISFMLNDDQSEKVDLEGRVHGQDNFDDNQWHHVALVRNGVTDECIIYVDGRITDRVIANFTSSFDNSAPVYIGSLTNSSPQYFYWGAMDELAIFNRALTKAEIDEIRANADLGIGLCNIQASPEIISTAVTKATVGSAYSYTVHAKGTQTGMVYSLIKKPTGMTINPTTGVISWTPASIDIDAIVEVKADNGIDPADTQSFTIFLSEGGGDCPDGLMALYRLNEKSGTVYADYKISHDAAVPNGYPGPTPSTGLIGDGAQTFGANTRIDIPDNGTEFDWARDASFSFEAWFKTTSSGVAALSRNRVDVGYKTSWWIGTSPQGTGIMELRDNASTNTVLKGTTVIADGQWHQVIGVRDGVANQNRLYVDGVLEGTLNQTFVTDFSVPVNLPVTIGYLMPWDGENQLHLLGDIDEVAIFTRAVTAAEATQFYNDGNPTGHCTSANYAPVFISTPVLSTPEDQPYSYTLTVDDINSTDTITLSAPVKPSWSTFTWTPGSKTALLSGTPQQPGNYNVTLRVTDNHITRDQVFTIQVTHVSDPPVITSEPVTSTNEKVLYTYTLTVTDADANDLISMEQVQMPAWLTLNHASGAKTATISGTPSRNDVGAHTIKINISDGYDMVVEEFVLTVVKVNSPPVITGQHDISVNEDESITIQKSDFIITDAEDSPDNLSIAVQEGIGYTVNGNTITPSADFNGTMVAYVTSSDLSETSLPFEFSINVVPVNDPPVITSEPELNASVGTLYYYILTATDVDNTSLTKSAEVLPAWLSYNATGGLIMGTPAWNNVGDFVVAMQVSDGTNTVNKIFTITVTSTTGIKDAENKKFTIYPIPARDELNISFAGTNEESVADIIDPAGNIIQTFVIKANTQLTTIPLNDAKPGLYICHIRNNSFNVSSRFMIIK